MRKYDNERLQIVKEWPETEVNSEEGKEGTLKFQNLTAGKYKLIESKSPDGYILISEAPEFEVVDENGVLKVHFTNTSMVTYDSENKQFTVKNESGVALPSTGGPGTRLFTILGSLFMMFAGVLLVKRRRRNAA